MEFDAAQATTEALFAAALAAVDVRAAVARSLAIADGVLTIPAVDFARPLAAIDRIIVVAVGKAAGAMAAEAEAILGDHIAAGLALTKHGHGAGTRHIALREGGHPTPDDHGLAATDELRALLRDLHPADLVLCLISGGGSALLTAPAPPITLTDLRATTGLLLAAGANINELNAVRKHLEVLKGGGLARAAAPAQVVALVISDVLGDPLDVIASGPCTGDTTTFADAWAVLERRELIARLPASVVGHLRAGLGGAIPETPEPDDPLFAHVSAATIANLPRAAEAVAARAAALGWHPEIIDLTIEGEAREVAEGLVARLLALPAGERRCLIGGGETTVTVRGDGVGGRNTELALAAALLLDGVPGCVLASLSTDGDDGPTGAAGAFATGATAARGRALALDADAALTRNDSATYFRAAGGLVVTGPTRTNVADVYFLLRE